MRDLLHLRSDTHASVLIETAFALPLLVILMLGAFDVSRMVARQTELQEVAAEVAAASMAREPNDATMIALARMAQISGGLSDDQVKLDRKVKCGISPELHDKDHACDKDVESSTFVMLTLSDTYEPAWTSFGIGEPVELSVDRSVQVS
jgi:hypothetical protein